jgi:hypothetical protein
LRGWIEIADLWLSFYEGAQTLRAAEGGCEMSKVFATRKFVYGYNSETRQMENGLLKPWAGLKTCQRSTKALCSCVSCAFVDRFILSEK